MHHHYPRTTVVLTAGLGLLSVNLMAQPMKPVVSTEASDNGAQSLNNTLYVLPRIIF